MFIRQVFCAIISLILLLCSCSSVKTDSEKIHLGDCILISSVGEIPGDLYQETEEIIGDATATRMLGNAMRSPWRL